MVSLSSEADKQHFTIFVTDVETPHTAGSLRRAAGGGPHQGVRRVWSPQETLPHPRHSREHPSSHLCSLTAGAPPRHPGRARPPAGCLEKALRSAGDPWPGRTSDVPTEAGVTALSSVPQRPGAQWPLREQPLTSWKGSCRRTDRQRRTEGCSCGGK